MYIYIYKIYKWYLLCIYLNEYVYILHILYIVFYVYYMNIIDALFILKKFELKAARY